MLARLVGATVLACAAMAAPAAAQNVNGTVDITGSVGERCEFTVDNALIPLGELSIAGSGLTAGQLDTAAVNGEFATLTGWCNGTSATMTVEAFPIENVDFVAAPPTGFDRVVNYTATAVASTGSANDGSAAGGAGTPSTVGVFSSNITVTLSASSTPNSGKLIAGDYEGSVDVTLSPAI